MYPEQFQKLRRFSLAMGVILFSYVVVGLEPVGEAPRVRLPFMDFTVKKPDLIPIGLVLASFWGLVRYWYYGLMTELAPWRHRRKALASAKKVSDEGLYSISFAKDSESADFAILLQRFIPRFINRELRSQISDLEAKSLPDISTGVSSRTKVGTRVTFNISQRQLAVAWFQDLDFYSPVIVNVVALGWWFYSVGLLKEFAVGFSALGLVGFGIYKWSERTSRPSKKKSQSS